MGLGLPLLIANSQSLTGWSGGGGGGGGGPFSPPSDRKNLCVPLPMGFPNVQTSDLLNSRNPYNHKNESSETIEIDEKDEEHTTQPTSSPRGTPAAGQLPTEQSSEDLEIKQEMSDFLHHPPLGRSESHRSFNSSTDDNRIDNDDFAQDLRVSAAARSIDFSRFGLTRGLLQQSEGYDEKFSPPLSRKQQSNQVHSNAQQSGTLTTTVSTNEQDDCDYVGSNVSIKLRSMERTQRIIAEKLISEVLFYGQIAELEKTAKILPK